MNALGLLVGLVIVGPLLCWLFGMGNPIGWMGVLPWLVPPCNCPVNYPIGGYRGLHRPPCPIGRGPRP